MQNKELIDKIEEVKSVLTQAQKDLEDGNLQGAGDCVVAATLQLKPLATKISDMFSGN